MRVERARASSPLAGTVHLTADEVRAIVEAHLREERIVEGHHKIVYMAFGEDHVLDIGVAGVFGRERTTLRAT